MKKIAHKSLYFLLYVVLSTVVLVRAHGYTLDTDGDIVSTAGIFFDTSFEDISIRLNGINVTPKDMPLKLMWLREGTYTLEVARDGYYSWKKDFVLHSGEVKNFQDVTLVPYEWNKKSLTHFGVKLLSDDLEVRDGHTIFMITGSEESFITQYAKPIQRVERLNKQHILVHVADDIYIIDNSGENQFLISEEVEDFYSYQGEAVVIQHLDGTIERYSFEN